MATKVKTTTIQKTEVRKTDITWVCGECKNEWTKESEALACCGRDPECTRCGRSGHTRGDCYARTHERGYSLSQPADRGACYRCGRHGHYIGDCYASRHIRGYELDD